jgi:hypothetical protein
MHGAPRSAHMALAMKYTANTLLLLAAGCGTSNAVIVGLPVGGQSAPAGNATLVSSSIGAGTTQRLQPVSAGVGGGSVMPALISAQRRCSVSVAKPVGWSKRFGRCCSERQRLQAGAI